MADPMEGVVLNTDEDLVETPIKKAVEAGHTKEQLIKYFDEKPTVDGIFPASYWEVVAAGPENEKKYFDLLEKYFPAES